MLVGKNILLRPIRLKDKKGILKLRLDFNANKAYLGFPFPITEINEKYWIQSLYSPHSRKRIDFAIASKKTKTFVGLISLRDYDSLHRRGRFGIFIQRKYWGKGYAREAMAIFFKYLFNQIGLQRIYLEVLESNKRAIRLYERFRFVKEGLLRQHYFQDGGFKNILVLGLLKKEFLKSCIGRR